MLWSLADPRDDGVVAIEYPYFETSGTAFHNTMTYVGHEGEIEQPWAIEFNHGLAEIITAVMDAGLDLIAFEEHDSVPWAALENQMDRLPERRVPPHRPPRTAAAQLHAASPQAVS